MRRIAQSVALVAATAAMMSCNEPLTVECPSVPVPGVRVIVMDSITSSPPAEAMLIARSPAFVDSVGPVEYSSAATTLVLYAVDRPGTYAVQIRSPGYHDWLRNSVEVTADACHVRTVTLTARLQAN